MRAIAFAAAALLTPALAAPATHAQEEGEWGVLRDAPGVDAVYAYCTPCHSERIVAQQGLSREDWIDLLDWMVEEQGMYPLEPPDDRIVIDYLAEHYGVDRPNYPVD